jgi:DivIVA domain-containing protein
MEQDDAEARIIELERYLAEQKRNRRSWNVSRPAEPAKRPVVTPEQVRNMTFSKPPAGKRGYNEDEVDAFLDRVSAALGDTTGNSLSPEQLRNMTFSKPPLGSRGYDEDEVDVFLDLVEQDMRRRATGANQGSHQGALPPPPQAAVPLPGPPTQQTRRGRGWLTIVCGLILGGLTLWVIADAAYGLWVLQFGTPASVELVQCERHAGTKGGVLPSNCTALWRQDDGSVRTVTVHSPQHRFNQDVDVHVRGGQAYASWSAEGFLFLGGSAFLGLIVWWTWPSRRSTASRSDDPGMRPGAKHLR